MGTSALPRLPQSFTENVFIYSASGAASGQLAIDHNGRKATNAVLFGSTRSFVLMHVLDVDVMLRPNEFFNRLDRLLAGCASSAEDFDFVFHNFISPFLISLS
jgi:hypothetical protein